MKDLYAVNECTVATQAGFVRGTALDVDDASLFCKSRGLTQTLLQRVSSNIRAVILMEDGGVETLKDVRERLVPTTLSIQLGERIATFLIDTFAVLRSDGWYHDGLTCGDIVVIRTTHEGVLSIKLCDYGTLSRHDEIRCKLLENINIDEKDTAMRIAYSFVMWMAFRPCVEVLESCSKMDIVHMLQDMRLICTNGHILRFFAPLFERYLANVV